MPFIDIEFGDYVPDRAGVPWNSGYLVDAEGVRPSPNGWRTGVDATAATSAATAIGAATVNSLYITDDDVFVGLDNALYHSDDAGSSWNDLTGTSTVSASPADRISFAQFDDFVVATNRLITPQSKDLDSTIGALFTDLTGFPSATNARYMARVRDHLFAGGLGGSVGNTRTVRWSDIGDPESWSTAGTAAALANQAGQQDLPRQYGAVTGIVGGEKFGLVFQETAISRFTYVGGNVVYQIDTISTTKGMTGSSERAPNAAVYVNGLVYFSAFSGIYVTDGYKVRSLSLGRLDEALFNDTISHTDALGFQATHAAHDEDRKSVYFLYRSDQKILAYNYAIDRFYFLPSQSADALASGMEGLSTGNERTDLCFGIISDSLKKWTAVPSSCDLQTGFMELSAGARSQLKAAHILGAGTSTPTIAYKSIESPNDLSVVQTGFTSMTAPNRGIKSTGRETGRYFAFRITGAQGAGSVMRGLRVYFDPVSEL